MAKTQTTTSKLAFVIGWDWESTKPHVESLKKQGLEVHIFTFPWKASTFPISQDQLGLIGYDAQHILTSPSAQGMDCIANVLTAVDAGITLAKKEKKDIHTIVNTLTIPKVWNFDTTLENWKKLFWFTWDHKEYVDDVVLRTWNQIKPKPTPIVVEEPTAE